MTSAASVERAPRTGQFIPILFTATIFTSALLLFFVQPLFTRMVLPQIGGAAAVWTTAMLFFQTVLIGGYLYAHLLTRHVRPSAQLSIHLGLLLLAFLFLPLSVPEGWQYDPGRPVVTQTLWLYALGVGLPFAVLSATAPLVQSWYRRSGGPSADDPYFLYAASNLGSLVALLAFPLVAEPLVGVKAISLGWSFGFVALAPLLFLAGLMARHPATREPSAEDGLARGDVLRPARIAYWMFLAFIPSSLMLCVTTKISTDLGSFPLVWVIPLALYLLTFVLVFSTRSPLSSERLRRALPLALAILIYASLKSTGTLTSFLLLLTAFFLASLLAHRLLFETRPAARHLTVFYLIMSVGGALGGLFNSIFAPIIFDRLLEYPITVVLVALLMIARAPANAPRELLLGVGLAFPVLLPLLADQVIRSDLGIGGEARAMLTVCLLLVLYILLAKRPLAVVVTTVTVLCTWIYVGQGTQVLTDRSFFGLHVITDRPDYRRYSNGNTVHGAQLHAETGDRPTPLTYYHPKGLMAMIVNSDRAARARTIGVVGLGTGALACYSRPGQDWHYFEIDQKVVDIALNPTYFRFMSECAPDAKIHLGDARIVLQEQENLKFDILVIDAYSSDAIPVHLATVEAIQLYLDRLAEDGILVVHISNRFYDLAQPLAAAAKALGLEGRFGTQPSSELRGQTGAFPSRVVVLARSAEALGITMTDPHWKALPEPVIELWTDDHADLLATLN